MIAFSMKKLMFLFYALLSGSVFISVGLMVAMYIVVGYPLFEMDSHIYVGAKNYGPLVALLILVASHFLYTSMIKKFPKDSDVLKKAAEYQRVSIMKYAMIEGACFLTAIGFAATFSVQFVFVFAMCLVVFGLNRPSWFHLERDFELSVDEISLLQEKDV